MRVLVVDDDSMARSLVSLFLTRAGHTVVGAAENGAVALELLGRALPDVVVTDCQMPEVDGIALVRRMRLAGNETRVVMLSGQSDRAVIDVALNAGVDAYLTKPMDPARLIAALGDTSSVAKPAA